MRLQIEEISSFPRFVWERSARTLCVPNGGATFSVTRDAERRDARSHAERGNEEWSLRAFLCTGVLVALLSGCMQQPEITVTIKSAGGAATETGAAATTEPAAESATGFGNLVGTVTLDGAIPPTKPLFKAGDTGVKDAAVCAAMDTPDESLIVNKDNQGIANVVIYLDKKPANIKPELVQPPAEPAVFDQKGCRFLPHVLPVRVGQQLFVKSDDPVPHNTHTYPERNNPFNSTIAPSERNGIPCNYSKAESMPLEVKCDFHTWMRAYHFPIDHPYFAVTDANGKFSIPGVPAGKQTFKVWHEKGKLLVRSLPVTIKADADTTHDLKFPGNKFTAITAPAARSIAFERLQRGGEIILTQKEGIR